MRSRRTPRCAGCWLPSALCLCAELPRLAVRTRVVVAMHRREAVTSSTPAASPRACSRRERARARGAARREGDPEPLPPGRRLVLFPAAEAPPHGRGRRGQASCSSCPMGPGRSAPPPASRRPLRGRRGRDAAARGPEPLRPAPPRARGLGVHAGGGRPRPGRARGRRHRRARRGCPRALRQRSRQARTGHVAR